MNIASLLLFAAAALLGMTLLTYILKNKNTPKALVLSHGFFAALGLFALIIYAIRQDTDLLGVALIFALAAAGGFILSVRDILGLSVPKWFAIGHGLLAAVGIVMLLK